MFQTCLPNIGPGALQSRENPNERSAKEIQHLGPATDFYKRHALECSGLQIAVDLFLMNSQYSDMATICKSYNIRIPDIFYLEHLFERFEIISVQFVYLQRALPNLAVAVFIISHYSMQLNHNK